CEAGRGSKCLDKHGKPLGFDLEKVLTLDDSPATYTFHRKVVKDCATNIVWGVNFSDQLDAAKDGEDGEDGEDNEDKDNNDDGDDDGDVEPTRPNSKRGSGNPNCNIPGFKQPQGKKLGVNPAAGPAQQKALARAKAKGKDKARK
ncbi:unnamed protein product, partial [Rhizoctonia solani]